MAQKFENISIVNLKLDLSNPRLPKSKQGKDDKTVIEFLLLEAATTELMESIAENDFFVGEMLLVIPDISDHGKFIVIEGNRRLTAVKLLNNPEIATVKKKDVKSIAETAKYIPTTLPCLTFDNRDEIQKFIGFVHITGKKSWRMLEKARYLHDLRVSDTLKDKPLDNACKEIARMIGSKSPYVRKMLISYNLYEIVEDEGFYQIDGLSDSTFFLNYFSDGLQKENIRNYININLLSEDPLQNINQEHLKEIVGWWFKKTEGVSRVIGDSEGMRILNDVLGNENALNAFKSGVNLFEAHELTNDIDNQFENKVKESLRAIEAADSLSNKTTSFYSSLYDDLKSIRSIANKINLYREEKTQNGDEF
ncbi:MAG: hypothetical protein K6F64_03685 [Clostridia bacterium]|nr:hypothetical protein [Clostridia bacterium]